MTLIGTQWYWDGGLFDNIPLSPVIANLKQGEAQELPIFMLDLFPIPTPVSTAGRCPRRWPPP